MAWGSLVVNPYHESVIREGVEAVKQWKSQHPNEKFDLSGIDLMNCSFKGLDLSEANLKKSDLRHAVFEECNFAKADLSESILANSNLINVNFANAKVVDATLLNALLAGSDFSSANLQSAHMTAASSVGTNFSNADLSKADCVLAHFDNSNFDKASFRQGKLHGTAFRDCSLMHTDFTDSSFGLTTFADADLSKCVGLETVKHNSRSMMSLYTIINSFHGANDSFTTELTTLFTNSGVPREILDEMPRIIGGLHYCTCFVCYGNPDHDFAERLVNDLRKAGVSCWLYSLDATPGQRTWGEITEQRRKAEKMVVICSVRSLMREGVKKEIEEQIDEDPEKIIPISRDVDWKQEGFDVKRGQKDLKPFLLERNYADFCEESKYKESFNRLLKGLRRH